MTCEKAPAHSRRVKPIHIAIGSTTSQPGDVAGNLAQIARFAEQAGAVGADVLLTPEMSASGYGPYPEVLATAEPAGAGPIYRELARLALASGAVICAGFVEAATGKRHLAHYIVYADGKHVVQRKHRVTLVERPLDPPWPLSGHPPDAPDPADPGQPLELHFEEFAIKGVKCALAICADGGITGLSDRLARAGGELLLAPTAGGGTRDQRVVTADLHSEAGLKKYYDWLERVFFPGGGLLDCVRFRRALAAVNLCGFDGRERYHIGHGMIISPMGEVPALIHGLPNLDRQRPMFTHAVVDVEETI